MSRSIHPNIPNGSVWDIDGQVVRVCSVLATTTGRDSLAMRVMVRALEGKKKLRGLKAGDVLERGVRKAEFEGADVLISLSRSAKQEAT